MCVFIISQEKLGVRVGAGVVFGNCYQMKGIECRKWDKRKRKKTSRELVSGKAHVWPDFVYGRRGLPLEYKLCYSFSALRQGSCPFYNLLSVSCWSRDRGCVTFQASLS